MQFLIAASFIVAGTSATLVAYPNGAIAPFDPANAAATADHLAANAEAGKLINPYGVHTTGVVVPHVYAAPYHLYGKREAQLVHHPNGAVTPPLTPAVAVATANHFAAKGFLAGYPYAGVYGAWGRKKREAQVPVNLVTGFTHTPYLGYWGHHVAPVVAPFTAHPNGALVPQEPADVVQARADHLATHVKREAQLVHHPNGAVTPHDPNLALATANHFAAKGFYAGYPYAGVYGNVWGRKKREAQVPVNLVTGFAHTPYLGYWGHHVAPVVSPFVAHPNGALVPAEPADVVEARADHLAAHAA